MRKNLKIVLTITSIFIFTTFSLSPAAEYFHRSGTMNDDEIEEPLKDNVLELKECLDKSNMIIDLLKEERYQTIYNDYFSVELKKQTSFENFSTAVEGIRGKIGKIISYKPMQWYFVFSDENGRKIVTSIKVVRCQYAVVYYKFVFDPKDKKHLVGFHAQLKKELKSI